jgi:hypothetical protein
VPSPDLSAYVDLTIYDKNPQDVFSAAADLLEALLPEVTLREGFIESVLLEALAQEVGEAAYALNRIPGAVVQILAQLFGVVRGLGAQPTGQVTFVLSDAAGHVLQQGVQVRLDLGTTDPVIFTTDVPGIANPGETTITVDVTGDRFTADANNVGVPADVTIVDAVWFVESASLTTAPVDGQDPEDTITWLSRFITRLTRLTTTLTLADQFATAALDDLAVYRATATDDWNAGLDAPLNLAAAPAAAGGALQNGATYGYAVTALTAQGETLPTATVNTVIPAGGPNTGEVVLTWQAPAAQQGAGAVTGYRVYRTAPNGAVLGLVATLGNVLTYTSTGSGAPGAAPPVANGTGQTLPGYVTVAVYGPTGPVSAAEKATLQTTLTSESLANLNVRVVDATVSTVNVDVTVVGADGYDAATVTADVTAALQDWLSTDTWLWDATVRRNELIAIVGSLPSVAYVETLTTPAADVALPGIAPLTTLGTLAVTVH